MRKLNYTLTFKQQNTTNQIKKRDSSTKRQRRRARNLRIGEKRKTGGGVEENHYFNCL